MKEPGVSAFPTHEPAMEAFLSVSTSLRAQHTVRPNKPKRQNLEQRKVYGSAMQGDQWLMP